LASLFALFKRKRRAAPEDPVAAFDALLEQLERQGAGVRRAAAALLASRGELQRSQARYVRQREELGQRLQTAAGLGDERAERVLRQDLERVERGARDTEEGLARVAGDAEVLLELARDLGERSAALRQERDSARARRDAEQLFTAALRQRTSRIEQVLAVDAARDELERAHALAEIAREDAGIAAPPPSPERTR